MTTGQQILEAAKGELGVQEQPLGSNRGKRVEFFQSLDWLAGGGYAWCVDFAWGYCTWYATLKKPNPYPTAAVFQLEAWAREHGWAVKGPPKLGDLMCFNGHHVTLFSGTAGPGMFHGLGGNQADRVKYSDYALSSVSTIIRVPSKMTPPKPKPKPRFEVVRGEGERARVVATVPTLAKAFDKAQDIFNKGGHGVRIRKKPPKGSP